MNTTPSNDPCLPLDDESEDDDLHHEMRCILVQFHRDRAQPALSTNATRQDIEALAQVIADRLAPRIGGRYVPKGRYRDGWQQRAQRDAAVWSAFNGRNRDEVMRQFGISRRLLYSILSRRRRTSLE